MLQVFTRLRASVLAVACASAATVAVAQTDTVGTLSVTGYADGYYAAFAGAEYSPGDLVEFETMSSRANTFGLNTAGISTSYSGGRIRANAEIFFGEVRETAWGGEFIKNANVGFEVAPGWWVDAGYFSTYVGVESALPKDNVFSSVAVSTFQEPYFHSGVKTSWEGTENLVLELWLMNQYSGYSENNDAKTIGLVGRYTFADDYTLSYTGTYGRETDGRLGDNEDGQLTLYNNFNLTGTPTDQLELIVNGSFATVTNSSGEQGDESTSGVNGMATVRYFVSDEFAIAARGSFVNGDLYAYGFDGDELLSSVNDFGISLQLLPTANTYLRLEGRTIGAQSDIFGNTDDTNDNADRRFDLVISTGINLGRDWTFRRN